MARHMFLGDIAAWALGIGGDETALSGVAGKHALVIPGGQVTFWTARTGGTPITDLQDSLGNAITTVTADSNGALPQIHGPDTTPDTWWMWADGNSGAGPRVIVTATDMGDAVNGLADTVGDMAEQLDANSTLLNASLGVVSYDAASSSWPDRPTGDTRRYAWFGPSAPTVGGTGMVENFDIWFNTAPAS